MTKAQVVALAGNPNSGKTTLFNRLTGMRQKVGNYPGVTVERRTAKARFATGVDVVDLPGTYSLVAQSKDEAVVFDALTGEDRPTLTVVVLDASNLDRNLYLATSILELGSPCLIALNMIDFAKEAGREIDAAKLSEALGVPVVPVVASRGEGVDDLTKAIVAALDEPPIAAERQWKLDAADEAIIERVAKGAPSEASAVWALASAGTAGDDDVGHDDLVKAARKALGEASEGFVARLISARYEVATRIAEDATSRGPAPSQTRTDRVDSILLHPVFGIVVFGVVMAIVFQSIFAWASPLMDLIEAGVGASQAFVGGLLPEGAIRDLLVQGVIGGVGNVIVFVPQIAILFLLIALLEDSGYLARAAFISDRLMAKVGLHGRAFVPLMSGFACAVPAIMAARTIESPKDRLVTILVTPLISCSARLPVYVLIIAALFSADAKVFGVISVGGLIMLAMYVLSVVFTIAVAFVLKRTLLESPTPPLVLELPPYRVPNALVVVRGVFDRCKVFIRDAGTVILACSIVLWALLYFPRNPDLGFDPASEAIRVRDAIKAQMFVARTPAARAEVEKRMKRAQKTLSRRVAEARLGASYGGRIGKTLEPAIEPLGFDWKIGIGLLASFAAREVFVSTMGLVYGIGDDVDEESTTLRSRLAADYSPLAGLALMIFFLLAAQCMSTVAIVKRETRSWKWPLFMIFYMNALAWIASLIVFQGGKLLGYG